MTSISYSYFFRVELLHKYFANNICNDFIITPSVLTQTALNGNKMLARQYGNTLYGALQVDDLGKAFMTPSNSLQLTFFLRLNNPVFFNYTNLPSVYQSGKVYYFTNRNSNVGNGKNFISQAIIFSNTTTYHPGDLAPDANGVMFECISTCTGIVPSAANSINWMPIDKNRYISEADALQWMPSVSTYTFSTPQTSAIIQVLAFNTVNRTFTTNVLSKTIPFAQSTKSFKLDLSVLSPGKYKLTVNGASKFIYINDELGANPAFAVIEIFNDSTLPAAYKLLTGTTLNSPLYSINFLNRATIWKYVLNSGSKGNITVNPPDNPPNSPPDDQLDFNFPGPSANVIVSGSPIPLSEAALNISLALTTVNNKPVNVNINDVACPSPRMLSTFSKGPDKYACSEIFLNY